MVQPDMFPDGLRMPPPTMPPNVASFPQPPQAVPPRVRFDPEPGPQREEDVGPALLGMAQAIARICATRILLLLAVVTASAIWCYTVYDPSQMRIIAAGVFSACILWPLVMLYWKRGGVS